jgi:hypothetical protein
MVEIEVRTIDDDDIKALHEIAWKLERAGHEEATTELRERIKIINARPKAKAYRPS